MSGPSFSFGDPELILRVRARRPREGFLWNLSYPLLWRYIV